MKPKVYLAGQITQNWWRNAICNNKDNRTPCVDVYVGDRDDYFNKEYDNGNCIITGPHAVGCDHSCFHDSAHASMEGCSGGIEYTHKDIADACCHQIEKSDIVFAYIENEDAFGTFSEVGYAHGLDKFVFILFKNKELADKLWFMSQMAVDCHILQNDTSYAAINSAFETCLSEWDEVGFY